MAIKVSDSERNKRDVVKVKTKPAAQKAESFNWWLARSKAEVQQQLLDTVAFLKEQQQFRIRQASVHARLYGNLPLNTWAGSTLNQLGAQNKSLPVDRPTMNVVQSCVDTLVSRISQARPRPVYLTENGNYKKRTLAKQMNTFISGELYQTKSYQLAEQILRDSSILGTGALKVYAGQDNKVQVERTLITELYVDHNDAFYGEPRTLYQIKLIDRSVLATMLPEHRSMVEKAQNGYPDSSNESQKTASDQVMIAEAWHLPSGKDTGDGRHTIVCSAGTLLDEPWEKEYFPFVFLNYAPRLVGFWAQGLSEQLMGTQLEINKLLVTISQSINLVGVPRVFVEDGSKVVKAHLNNQIGSIVTYRGTKPQYEVAPCVPAELYQQLQRLIDYAYQQSGVSALAAASQKPAGLNSGEAIRNYDDLQSDRFATLNKRYNAMFIDLVNKIIDCACDIAEITGKYQTVYPDKDGTRQIDLPEIKKLKEDPFVIQCYDSSSLPKDPSGRLQKVTELMQSGIIDQQEGRRLLDFPDLSQDDKLAMAAEERILKQLDDIVEDGKYEGPDGFTDIQIGKKKVTQYYNLYTAAGLEESKAEMLRNWQAQLLQLEQQAMAAMAPPPGAMPGAPIAQPQAAPQSDLMPINQ